ncbi:ZIFL1 [Symbiodinium sp. CCMP2456]|nr:ZIFL1 [Symbiodinium sp. CCMP2456]
MEEKLNSPYTASFSLLSNSTALRPSAFTVPVAQEIDLNSPATMIGQCTEMIQMAMQQKVAPTHPWPPHNQPGTIECPFASELLGLKRTRTIVCRNRPSWLTEQDSRLTVEKALAKASHWNIEGMWNLATSRLDTAALRLCLKLRHRQELAATSILTVPSRTARKRILDLADSLIEAGDDDAKEEKAKDEKDPLLEKEALIPRWKTLALVDSKEAWPGRIVYKWAAFSQNTHDWNPHRPGCQTHILSEHAPKLLESWRKTWYGQLRQHVNQTTVDRGAKNILQGG